MTQDTKVENVFDTLASIADVDMIEPIRNNNSDHKEVSFAVYGNSAEIVRWCRRNFGERGDGWDFNGTNKYLEVRLWSSKLIMMWELWQN